MTRRNIRTLIVGNFQEHITCFKVQNKKFGTLLIFYFFQFSRHYDNCSRTSKNLGFWALTHLRTLLKRLTNLVAFANLSSLPWNFDVAFGRYKRHLLTNNIDKDVTRTSKRNSSERLHPLLLSSLSISFINGTETPDSETKKRINGRRNHLKSLVSSSWYLHMSPIRTFWFTYVCIISW